VLVGPGGLDQLGAQVGLPHLVMWPRQVEVPLEYSLGSAHKAQELRRAGEPAPVADLAGQGERAQAGDPR
jgi:hypothetical protein